MTRYCFKPSDPTVRYVMSEYLEAAGFVECPPPGEPIPATLMAGPGGVLDRTAAALATTLRNKMGANPSEDQLKALSDMINGADLKLLEKQEIPKTITPPVVAVKESVETGAMMEPAQVVPDQVPITPTEGLVVEERVTDPETGQVTIKDNRTVDIREMTSIPLVEIAESADDYTVRIFNGPLKSTDKTTILNYGLKNQNVTLDMSKTKPQLIKDLQMLEIYDASKKG